MKQVNVLMDESLLDHVEKLSQLVSLLNGKKITVSDMVRRAVINYTKHGHVVLESYPSNNGMQINVKSVGDDDELPNDELMRKLCKEEW